MVHTGAGTLVSTTWRSSWATRTNAAEGSTPVTRAEGLPSAVLVRAIEPLEGVDLMRERRGYPRRDQDLTNGPGKLCLALGITGEMNGFRLDDSPLTVIQGEAVPDDQVEVTPRIGITKAAAWPLRWFVRGNTYVSRAPAVRRRA